LIPSREETGSAKFELAISYLLITGVIASLILVGFGILLFHHEFGYLALSEKKEMFLREQNFFRFLLDLLWDGHGQDKALWLMTLGIAVLILTPYARVILSVLYFIGKRDMKYAFITLFVLILLTISLLVR
jgi:uncharacterized membrane protein